MAFASFSRNSSSERVETARGAELLLLAPTRPAGRTTRKLLGANPSAACHTKRQATTHVNARMLERAMKNEGGEEQREAVDAPALSPLTSPIEWPAEPLVLNVLNWFAGCPSRLLLRYYVGRRWTVVGLWIGARWTAAELAVDATCVSQARAKSMLVSRVGHAHLVYFVQQHQAQVATTTRRHREARCCA